MSDAWIHGIKIGAKVHLDGPSFPALKGHLRMGRGLRVEGKGFHEANEGQKSRFICEQQIVTNRKGMFLFPCCFVVDLDILIFKSVKSSWVTDQR